MNGKTKTSREEQTKITAIGHLASEQTSLVCCRILAWREDTIFKDLLWSKEPLIAFSPTQVTANQFTYGDF